jgi:enolase
MSQIIEIKARQILDSRGNPTIETEVYTHRGVNAKASVPCDSSLTNFRAKELRDNDQGKYSGQGVTRAVTNINKLINEELKGSNIFNQSAVDSLMIQLDGTQDKSSIGVNAILSVSLAIAKAAALSTGQSLYRYLGGVNATTLPIPMINVLENVSVNDKRPMINEFMIMPVGIEQFSEALRAGVEVWQNLKKGLSAMNLGIKTGISGGLYTEFKSNSDAIELLIKAIEVSGYKPGEDIVIGIDAGGQDYYDETKKKYIYPKQNIELTPDELIAYWEELYQKFPIVSIEDPLHYNDWESWVKFTEKAGDKIQVAGDDFFVGNPERFQKAIDENVANSIIIKPIQIGTVTEIINLVHLGKSSMYNTIFSSSANDSEDTSNVELTVALNAGIIKTGAFSEADANIKYNRLCRIEEELGESAKYGNH